MMLNLWVRATLDYAFCAFLITGPAWLRSLGVMTDTGHPPWILLVVIGFIPFATASELVAALFSKRVRKFIVSHPLAHVFWFGFTILCILLLVPARSGPHQPF
jgi:hypothetical protein